MTPGEAKPHGLMFVTEMQMVDGKLCGPVHMGFTAKETAEIAQTYCRDYINSTVPYQKGTVHLRKAIAWKNLFEGWSK